jgi:aspartyl-tRNA(Asn)/glutamyl-tRNA(Gln) amidotransferase subunit A
MVASAADLAYLTAVDAGGLFRSRELSPVELVRALLERIERLQPSLKAYVTVTAESALAEARAAEAAILAGDERPLLGVPVAAKDIYMTAGVRTTAGSRVHEQWTPDVTATAIVRLREAGAVLLGKLTTHEFATGMTTDDHPLPPARNPWNPNHVPGGSSSGSGAALAAGLAVGALGSDTGGSIRNPASYCGIAGLKPTYGRVSRHGIVTLAWSLDHAGPMARTCEDLALMMSALAGYDRHDPAAADVPAEEFRAGLDRGVRGLRIGVPRSWYAPTVSAEVGAAVDAALEVFRGLGAAVVDVELPSVALGMAAQSMIVAEGYSYHAGDLAAVSDLYSPGLRNRLSSGALMLASDYLAAQRAREVLKAEMATLLTEVDLLVSPSNPTTAPTFEQGARDALRRGPGYTGLYNMTGQPALSIPCGFDGSGLPIGLQIAGRPFADRTVLRAGHAYERAAGWYTRHPAL